MREIRYTSFAQQVVFSVGAVEQIGLLVEHYQWRRLMLCTSGSLLRDGQVARMKSVLGRHLVATYEPVMPHVPDYQVQEALCSPPSSAFPAAMPPEIKKWSIKCGTFGLGYRNVGYYILRDTHILST